MIYIYYWLYISIIYTVLFLINKRYRYYLVLVSVPLVSAIFFSLNILAPDKFAYEIIFGEVSKLSTISEVFRSNIHGEVLYKLTNWVFSLWSEDFYIFSLLCFLFSVSIKIYYFKKFEFEILAVVMFLVSHPMLYQDAIQVRVGIATAFVIGSIALYFLENKRLLAVLLILFASMFHVTAIITLVGFILCECLKKWSLQKALFFILITASSFKILGGFDILVDFFASVGYLPDRASNYLEWEKFQVKLSILNANTIKQFAISALLTFLLALQGETKPWIRPLAVFYFLSPAILIGLSDMAIFATRLASYFASIEPIILAYVFFSLSKKYSFMLVYLFCSIMYFSNTLFKGIFVNGYKSYIF